MAAKKGPPRSGLRSTARRPPEDAAVPARVRRRRKTAHAAVRKDSTLFEAAEGPRILWGRTKPKIKKG